LQQINSNLNPVGSISPTGTLSQPTSVLNSPNTVQQAGFPTVPSYNIGTPAPSTQSFASTTAATGNSIASPVNPGNQNAGVNAAGNSASFPTNPLFP
jgi:hypothetical protein